MSQLAKTQLASKKTTSSQIPTVSVFMSVYNGGDFLAQAVESVLNQTYKNFEFVIVNDGSTDGTEAYLNQLKDQRLRIIHQENQGLGKPLNKWMQACKGEFVMRLDADDICHSERLEKQMEYLQDHPEVMMVGCQLRFFTEDGYGHSSNLFNDHERIVSGMLKGWHTMSHPTIMFRKSLLSHIDGYAFSGAGEDWSFILDAARFGKLAVLPEVLYDHRLHYNSNAWQGAEKVFAGLAYARKRYKTFAQEGIEYPVNLFWKKWKQRSWILQTQTRLKAISAILYRKATLNKIKGNPTIAFSQMVQAALLDPHKTIGAIKKKLGI